MWLQEWSMSRSNAAPQKSRPDQNGAFPGLGPRPDYLRDLPRRDHVEVALKAFETTWSEQLEKQIRSALKFIPADQYDIWIKVGMALKSLGWDRSDGTSIGFEVWDEWSATCREKYSLEVLEAKWPTFNVSYTGQHVTIGTIFHLARQRGWTASNQPNDQQNGATNDANGGASGSGDANDTAPGSGSTNDTGPESDESKNSGSSDVDREISRLAKLGMIEYEQERKDAAARLNLRTSILDRLVAAERDELNEGGRQGHALNLSEPEPWPEPVNGASLLDAIVANVRQHVVMFDHAADALALWAVHTYLLDSFGVSPRLAITSPEKGCGKTTALDVVLHLVRRPLSTANASAAAIFRVVELQRPTLLIDEADTFLPENEELRGILNSGHRQGGSVIRTVGEEFEPRSFSTYSACAIALIGRLPATLADRPVAIELRRRRADEPIKPFRFDRTGHLDQLARKAARWAADNADRIQGVDPDMPASVFNRVADNWRPLLAIADAAGGEWPARARRAVQCAGASATGDDQSVRVLLLTDIRAIFAEKNADRLSSAELVTALFVTEGRPWAEWNRGRGLSANALARLLAPFGIAPATIRTATGTPKGYQLTQFEDAFARYLSGQ